jgi:hypothetical protein
MAGDQHAGGYHRWPRWRWPRSPEAAEAQRFITAFLTHWGEATGGRGG